MEPRTGIRQVPDGGSPSRGRKSSRSGFTLIEVALAVVLLVVALVALSASAVRVQGLTRSTRERMLAQNALRTRVEEIHSISRAGLTHPLGWGTHVAGALAPLASFPVEGLTPVPGASGVGSVRLITDETASDAGLGVELGLPRDLDGDGSASSTNVGTAARLLPVVVELRWLDEKGEQATRMGIWILGY